MLSFHKQPARGLLSKFWDLDRAVKNREEEDHLNEVEVKIRNMNNNLAEFFRVIVTSE